MPVHENVTGPNCRRRAGCKRVLQLRVRMPVSADERSSARRPAGSIDAPLMEDQETQQKFAELHARSRSFGAEAFSGTTARLQKLHHAKSDEWCRNGAEMVQFSPRKVQEIESLLAGWELWMAVGEMALARHRNLQPQRRVSLSMAARLADLASKLGRLAVGMKPAQARSKDGHPPETFTSWNQNVAEALRRACGDPPPSKAFAGPAAVSRARKRRETKLNFPARLPLRRED